MLKIRWTVSTTRKRGGRGGQSVYIRTPEGPETFVYYLEEFLTAPEEPGESLGGCRKFPEGLRLDFVGPRLDRRTQTIGIYA